MPEVAQPSPIPSVPAETARVIRAAFPKGNLYLKMRDALGLIDVDERFAPLYPARDQPAEAPWRLALVLLLPFAEGFIDPQAAEAGRSQLDEKYLRGLTLTALSFDFSVLSEFRKLIACASATVHLLVYLTDTLGRLWCKGAI
jgi:transposase